MFTVSRIRELEVEFANCRRNPLAFAESGTTSYHPSLRSTRQNLCAEPSKVLNVESAYFLKYGFD